ncbi:hypothetical protein HDU87_003476 [Geranomyces variabilis]|uniref:Uncharacterized protein n=1 Tax=Geranomyces variabilis TaxID=109894 RepID=A0AAD5TM91_9FUNG|nr:hypothetical protein HDU87_003476 [Geranomyces variabilis]
MSPLHIQPATGPSYLNAQPHRHPGARPPPFPAHDSSTTNSSGSATTARNAFLPEPAFGGGLYSTYEVVLLKRDLEAVMGELLRQLKVAIRELAGARITRAENDEAAANALNAERQRTIEQIKQSVATLQDSLRPQLENIAQNFESVVKQIETTESRLTALETLLATDLDSRHAHGQAEIERPCAAFETRIIAAVEQSLRKVHEKRDAALARERDAREALLAREREARDVWASSLTRTLAMSVGTRAVSTGNPDALHAPQATISPAADVTVRVKSESPVPDGNRARKQPRQRATQSTTRPLHAAAVPPRPVRTLPAAPIYVLDFEETENWTDMTAPAPSPFPSSHPVPQDSTEIIIVPDEEHDINPSAFSQPRATSARPPSRIPSPPPAQVPEHQPASKRQRAPPKKRKTIKKEGGAAPVRVRIPPDPNLRPVTRARKRKLQSDG